MTVKRSRSASRVLAVLESIARHQPIGVSTLARELAADKSAVQRAIMTLADSGWIHPAAGAPTRWQLTARILAVAHMGHSGNDLRQRARGTLEALRDECGETVLLDRTGYAGVRRDRGDRKPAHAAHGAPYRHGGAGSRQCDRSRHDALHDRGTADPALGESSRCGNARRVCRHTQTRGFSVSDGEVTTGATTIAAPILEVDGRPSAAVAVSAPSGRMPASHHARIGAMISEPRASSRVGRPPIRVRAKPRCIRAVSRGADESRGPVPPPCRNFA
jgi:DNA-binding IclR family transcriptional regulator